MVLDEQLLANAFKRVLEDAAFVFAEPGELALTAEQLVRAEVGFLGPEQGRLVIAIPLALGEEIAANLTGAELDPSDALASAMDATGEVVNMVAGALLAEWFGPTADYDLGTPHVEVVSKSRTENPDSQTICRVVLATDADQRVDAMVTLPSPQGPRA